MDEHGTSESTDRESDAPALEVHVGVTPRDPRQRAWRVGLVLLALVFGAAQPWLCGVSVLLPCLFVWLGYRVALAAERPYSLALRAEGLEVRTEGALDLIHWSEVESVGLVAGLATFHFAGGSTIQVPRHALADAARVLDAVPASVRRAASVEQMEVRKGRAWRTIALWIALVALLAAVYALTRSGP